MATKESLWTDGEIERLRNLCATDMTYEEMAVELGRSVGALRHKASKLGIKRDRMAQFARHAQKLREKFDAETETPRDINVWKRRVFLRDNFTCQDCGLHCPTICHAHHVVQRVDAPDRKFDVTNGVTLCPNCHALRHVEIGRASSGRRLSRQQKDYVYASFSAGHSYGQIATALGVNTKTVASIVKAK